MKNWKEVVKVLAIIAVGLVVLGYAGMYIGDRVIKSYPNPVYGVLNKKFLKQDTVIYGYPCRAGKVMFYNNDSIMFFVLARDHMVNGSLIPGNSRVTMYYTGNPEFMFLSEESTIEGYRVSNRPKNKHWHAGFYNDGSLGQFMPAEEYQINGVPCQSQEWITLRPDGELFMCNIAIPVSVGDTILPAGTQVLRNGTGGVEAYSAARERELRESFGLDEQQRRLCCP